MGRAMRSTWSRSRGLGLVRESQNVWYEKKRVEMGSGFP